MNLNSISPYVRCAAHSRIPGPFHIGQRIIFDYEIIYLAKGKLLFSEDGRDYICNKGDVIFIRPGHPHTFQSIDDIPITQPHMHFDLQYDEYSDKVYVSFKDYPQFSEEEKKMIRRDELPIGPVLKISDIEAFSTLLYEIISSWGEKKPYYQLDCKEKLIAVLKMILKDNEAKLEEDRSVVLMPAMIKHYIDYNFQSHIDLDGLEKQFGYSRFHICRAFREYTGDTVIHYYNKKRVEYAKGLLSEGVTVSEMAEKLHFSSIYHFSRFFKNEVGIAPSKYAECNADGNANK